MYADLMARRHQLTLAASKPTNVKKHGGKDGKRCQAKKTKPGTKSAPQKKKQQKKNSGAANVSWESDEESDEDEAGSTSSSAELDDDLRAAAEGGETDTLGGESGIPQVLWFCTGPNTSRQATAVAQRTIVSPFCVPACELCLFTSTPVACRQQQASLEAARLVLLMVLMIWEKRSGAHV